MESETTLKNTIEQNQYFLGEPPLVGELLADTDAVWGNIYLKTPPLKDVDVIIPQPAIHLSQEEDTENYYMYPERQYLIRIIEFLEACNAKADEQIANENDAEKRETLIKLKEEMEEFKNNLSFITMEKFNEIMENYAQKVLEMILQNKTIFFYEQKARSERYLIVNILNKLASKIENLQIDEDQKQVLFGRIRYNPSFEESGTPSGYYDRAGDKLTEDAVVIYVDDFIQSGNYFLTQKSGAKHQKDSLIKREGYRTVKTVGLYVAANQKSIDTQLERIDAKNESVTDDNEVFIAYKMRGYWGFGLSGSWSSLDYLYQDQLKEYSKKLQIPLPFGYNIKGRYDRRVTNKDGTYTYGEYMDSNFNRMYESVKDRFKIDYKS